MSGWLARSATEWWRRARCRRLAWAPQRSRGGVRRKEDGERSDAATASAAAKEDSVPGVIQSDAREIDPALAATAGQLARRFSHIGGGERAAIDLVRRGLRHHLGVVDDLPGGGRPPDRRRSCRSSARRSADVPEYCSRGLRWLGAEVTQHRVERSELPGPSSPCRTARQISACRFSTGRSRHRRKKFLESRVVASI